MRHREIRSIIIPGFSFTGLPCGIKAGKNQKDFAVIFSQNPQTTVAGVFTQNAIKAAPVQLCQKNLKNPYGQLILVNSGIANAATGKAGRKDVNKISQKAAHVFNLSPQSILLCSTGKIGPRLPLAKMMRALPRLKKGLSENSLPDFAQAICTTDAYLKVASFKGQIGPKKYTLAVIAKGAGMIHPKMATLLCFVVTDLKIKKSALQIMLQNSVDDTLNSLTVDGDTSTNDTVIMMANGLAGNTPITTKSSAYHSVEKNLKTLLEKITVLIALDGEGATKCLKIFVQGARTNVEAKKIAKAIGNSPLVKTAAFGNDPNWGRILCAAGYSGASVREENTTIKIGSTTVFHKGRSHPQTEKKVSRYLKNHKVIGINVRVGSGKGRARVFASDLTYAYVKLNADYHT
jgi:glutamate N-acetyltransferase/amino-acid N-acetyltransferase